MYKGGRGREGVQILPKATTSPKFKELRGGSDSSHQTLNEDPGPQLPQISSLWLKDEWG